jgi:DNA polymerase II large subunit
MLPYFDPKFNNAKFNNLKHACKHCASENIIPVKHKNAGKTTYQTFKCGDCGQYAGRSPVSAVLGKNGQIG